MGDEVRHTYKQPGTFTVVLTVTDDRGGQAQKRLPVIIDPPPPNGLPTIDLISVSSVRAKVGDPIEFSSSATDSDGQVVSTSWEFGDTELAEGDDVEHAYDQPGRYKVTLTVTDDRGGRARKSRIVIVIANQGPDAAIDVASRRVKVDDPIRFSSGDSDDADGKIVRREWSFGDGEKARGTAVSHAYDQPGRYKVTLIVTDDDGAQDQASITVIVRANEALNAAIDVAARRAKIDGLIRFNSNGSESPDGKIVRREWSFGDGDKAGGTAVNHAYDQPGRYKVTLVVTDDNGAQDEASVIVSIRGE